MWASALATPRPALWAYGAVAAAANAEQRARVMHALVDAGLNAWRTEARCWDAWHVVLSHLAHDEWPLWVKAMGNGAASTLFSAAWQCGQWQVLQAFHGALHRLHVVEGAHAAAQVTLRLLQTDRVPTEDAPLLLAAALGRDPALYALALDVAVRDASCRTMRALLENPASMHDVAALRAALPQLVAVAQQCADGAVASRCVERTIRLAPPYNVTQLAARLNCAYPRDSPASVRACMAVLAAARKICPTFWYQAAGLVSGMVSRALHLISHLPEGVTVSPEMANVFQDWVSASRSVGREIGAGGADLKKRKHHLAFALSDWLSRDESGAALEVRRAVWSEGMVSAMEAACYNDKDLKESYGMLRGGQGPRQEWKR